MQSRPATLPEQHLSGRSAALGAACPSDEDLLAYLPGGLSGPKADSIAAHLATCVACQTRASTLKQRLSHRVADAQTQPAPSEGSQPQGSVSPTTLVQELRPRIPARLGDYELLHPIGRGGMGLVYRARHVRLQRLVAVKVLPHLQFADDSAIVRMQRESAAAGRVRHPNIVYATDAGEVGGIHYLVMELVPGIDLSKLVAVLGLLPVAEACEIVRQAALGLAHIAECGLVHRDLKPSNVMLADDGVVKILDLGLARVHHHNPLDDSQPTQAGYLLGTADYIAPEQIDSPHDADVRSDLYSLGCTFYKLLAGCAPFSGPEQNSVSRKVEAHRHAPPPAIRTLRPDVPEPIEQLLLKLLAKRPADRVQRPQELAEALAPFARAADLPALIKRLRERGDLDGWPIDPVQVPISTNASTQSVARSKTPLVETIRRRSYSGGVLVAVGVALVAAAVGIGMLAASIGRNSSGQTTYDLSAPLGEVQWIGYIPSPPPVFNKRRGMLEVRPDSFQLIELGQYDGRPGTFSATISQANWHGDAGLFFGCRPEPRMGRPELTTFQLFALEYFPEVGVQQRFRLMRQRAFIGVDAIQLHHDLDPIMTVATEEFARPAGSQIRIEITFGKSGCEGVRVNDQPLAELSAAALNANYLPEDYRGAFGLYCAPGGVQPGPTWFGNVVFTPAE
jgi:eukaryotic-like serine/threonine-protein kinase